MRKLLIAIVIVMLTVNTVFATTLLDVRTRVRAYLHETDTTNSTWTDAQVTQAVNAAQDYITNALPASCHYNLITKKAQAMTPSQSTYALPADFKSIISVRHWANTDTPLIQLTPINYLTGSYKATTKDPAYFIMGTDINVYPAPTLNQQMDYLYMKQPTRLSGDSDVVTLLTIYDEALVIAASLHLLSMDNQKDRASAVKAYLDLQLANIAEFFYNSNIVEPKRQKAGN